MSNFVCLECGKKFRTVRAAERAADEGCPRCGGVDIDLDVNPTAGCVLNYERPVKGGTHEEKD